MDEKAKTVSSSRALRILRIVVLALSLLAVFVGLLLIGPRLFAYFSFWALGGTMLSMALLIARDRGWWAHEIDVPIAVAAVIGTVLLMVEARRGFDGATAALPVFAGLWVGIFAPLIQLAAAFSNRAFRQPRTVLAWLTLTVVAYILLLEVVFRPLGFMPYAALPLEDDIARLRTYGLILALAFLAHAGLFALAHLLERNGLMRRNG